MVKVVLPSVAKGMFAYFFPPPVAAGADVLLWDLPPAKTDAAIKKVNEKTITFFILFLLENIV
jgi:hypothetical protein